MLVTMAIRFDSVRGLSLTDFSAEAPSGAVIGLVGEDIASQREILRVASMESYDGVERQGHARLIGPDDLLALSAVENLLLDHALIRHPELVRRRAMIGMERLRRAGSTILLCSTEQSLLSGFCDELWWIEAGTLKLKGHPRVVLPEWQAEVSRQFGEWGQNSQAQLIPSLRRGDGRAELELIETLDGHDRPASVWTSGVLAAVRVRVRYSASVADPVIGVMLRTRVGMEVYGTNTELEKLALGPVSAGEIRSVLFRFVCHLCPNEYTVTAASHDPDGVWHDWMEDAIAVSVTDTRYTAGVANLRAEVVREQ